MRAARIICRYVSNSWPIAWLASGPPIRNAAANSLRRATSNSAVTTAQAIGDDRLQQSSRGTVVPDSFTHGSSAQRVQWLTTGLKSGEVDSCNTFAQ